MPIASPFYGAMTGAPRGPGVRRVGASPYVGGPPVEEAAFTPAPSAPMVPPAPAPAAPPPEDVFTPLPREKEPMGQPGMPKDFVPPEVSDSYWEDFYSDIDADIEAEKHYTYEPSKMISPERGRGYDVYESMGFPTVEWDPKAGSYKGIYKDEPAISYEYEPSWGAGGIPTGSVGGYTTYEDVMKYLGHMKGTPSKAEIGIPWGEAPPGGVKAW